MTIHQNISLSELLFYRIGGIAAYVLEVKSVEDVLEAYDFIQKNNIASWMVVGLGANLLMKDGNFDGAIIWMTKPDTPDITISQGLINVFAGQTLDDLVQFSFEDSYIGLESLGGLPSTVGGAIRGNAGAFGTEMQDVIERVEVYDLSDRQIKTISNQECEFSYRNSVFKHINQYIILRGIFRLHEATEEEVIQAKNVYQEKISYRETNHPVEYPSCGSVFKNVREPEKVQKILSVWPDIQEVVQTKWHGKISMGYAIKRLGFSGMQVGGAKITEKHANYICNVDHAKARDVLDIISQIKTKFEATFGFPPEIEAEIVS